MRRKKTSDLTETLLETAEDMQRVGVMDAATGARIRRRHLEALVGGITEENRHEVVDFGAPVGREFW